MDDAAPNLRKRAEAWRKVRHFGRGEGAGSGRGEGAGRRTSAADEEGEIAGPGVGCGGGAAYGVWRAAARSTRKTPPRDHVSGVPSARKNSSARCSWSSAG